MTEYEVKQEIKKSLSYTLDRADKNNVIKPSNFINNKIKYTLQDVWPVLNNLNVYNGESESEFIELKPILDYIIYEYNNGVELLEILHRLAESYVRNLDDTHKNFICQVIKYGRDCNNVRTDMTLEKGIYNMMFRHFAKYIFASSRSWYSYDRKTYSFEAERIYLENIRVFLQIENMDF